MVVLRIIAVILPFLFLGCGGSGGDGDSIPNVAGIYDQTNITTICFDFFDSTVEVVQDGDDIIIQATTSGFVDSFGTIDADGDFTVNGTFGDGTPFECNGSIVGEIASAQCEVDSVTCNVTYERR